MAATNPEYHDYMSSGIRELHRLWGGPEEDVHTNPGGGIGEIALLALAVGAGVIFYPQLKPWVDKVRKGGASPAKTAKSGAATTTSTAAGACAAGSFKAVSGQIYSITEVQNGLHGAGDPNWSSSDAATLLHDWNNAALAKDKLTAC